MPAQKVTIKKNAGIKGAMMLLEDAHVTGQGFAKKADKTRKTKEKKTTMLMFDNPMPAGKKKKKKRHRKSSSSKSLKRKGVKVDEA